MPFRNNPAPLPQVNNLNNTQNLPQSMWGICNTHPILLLGMSTGITTLENIQMPYYTIHFPRRKKTYAHAKTYT